MAPSDRQPSSRVAWRRAKNQHDVISREQLQDLGYSVDAIRHRLDTGRFRAIYRAVYAVGQEAVVVAAFERVSGTGVAAA